MSMKLFIPAIVFLIAAGCSASLPVPFDGDRGSRIYQGSSVSTEELRTDREVYIRKCSGCHGLYLPEEYSRERWQEVLPGMNEKARVTEQEALRIERYLLSYSMKNATQ